MTWGSLGQGILTGKYNRENVCFGADDRRSREIYVNFHGEKLEQNLRIVEALKNRREPRKVRRSLRHPLDTGHAAGVGRDRGRQAPRAALGQCRGHGVDAERGRTAGAE